MKSMKPMIILLAAFIMLGPCHPGFSRNKPAYALFDSQGRQVDYSDMLQKALESDVVLFGELHNNPIAHWLQYELTRDLFAAVGQNLVLGAEMFETDNQLLLDEYLGGLIPERNFRAEAKLWNNYSTDYSPLVEFAREQQLRFVATNIPRRYASLVNREGFEGLENLSAEARTLIPPLPVPYDPELPGYKAMLDMGGMPGHTNENFPKAQAIKDATMAHFIYQNMLGDGVFLHFHGTYHSNNYEGIVWYLQQISERMLLMTISTVEQEDISSLNEDFVGQADFIIAVPATMTKTY
jgi:uncharacterized iron-regulated protein